MDRSPSPALAQRLRPILLLLFVGSGCSALIYEIVWLQLIELVIGSSAVSLGVLLATFMGGLCLGSLAYAHVISPSRHPLRVYALLELGIGAIAIAVLFAMPYVSRVYIEFAGYGLGGILVRAAASAILVLPPTILMGATLPAISRWVETTSSENLSWLGFLYASNIVGAVFGCLLAGFYLLPVYDMAIATYVAAAINGALAVVAFALSAAAYRGPVATAASPSAPRKAQPWVVYLTIGLSGLTALGAQVVWTRILSLILGMSVYTFSVILAVFLFGLAIGSSVGSYIARTTARPRLALAVTQLLLVASIAWAAATINGLLPYWPIDPTLTASPWYSFHLDLVRCTSAILPATCLWGASFPLALAAATSPGEDPARMVGRVYAANTIGAIVGALAFSMFLIPALGTHNAQRLLIALSAAAGLIMLAPALAQGRGHSEPSLSARFGLTVLAGSLAAAVFLAWAIPSFPKALVGYGRNLPAWSSPTPDVRYLGEGRTASIAVTYQKGDIRSFHVGGNPEASNILHDMRLQRMLGHLSGLLHSKPRSVLIVGFGAGVTAGSFVTYPDIERIVICEIEPLIPRNISRYFTKENYDVLNDPRVEVIYDDARHYLLTTSEKFDIITSDPIHPWVKGAASLYTREYYDTVKRHLNPGGVVTQWVPLYMSTLDVAKSEFATFFKVFPDGIIWGNETADGGYDLVMFGQAEPKPIEVDTLRERLASSSYRRVKSSLRDVEFNSVTDLLATYGGRAVDLGDWLADAFITTDLNLRLQYVAGMAYQTGSEIDIYSDLLRYREFPDALFIGSEETKLAIQTAMLQGPRVQDQGRQRIRATSRSRRRSSLATD